MKNNTRLRTALIINIFFCIFIISFTVYLSYNNIHSFLNCARGAQEVLVSEMVKHLQDGLALNDANETKADVIDNVMGKAEISNNRFWILAEDNEIIFIRDKQTSEIYKGKTVSDLLKEFKIKGGNHIGSLENAIESEMNGSVSYSRSRNADKEIISLSFFKADHKNYMVGVSTTEPYFFSFTDIYRDRIYLYALVGLLCSVIFILLIYFLLQIQAKDIKIQDYYNLLQTKNQHIEDLNQRHRQRDSLGSSNNLVYDQLTNVYSKQFFFAILDNASKLEVSPVSIILIHLKDYRYNLSVNDIKEAADILKGFITENRIITRVEYSDFAIVLVGTAPEEAYDISEKIEQELMSNLRNISVDIKVKDIDSLNS